MDPDWYRAIMLAGGGAAAETKLLYPKGPCRYSINWNLKGLLYITTLGSHVYTVLVLGPSRMQICAGLKPV